jgi:phage portal protein BeeE
VGIRLTASGGWAGLAEDRSLPTPDVQPSFPTLTTSAPLNVSTSNALRVADAYACVRLLADTIATLPLKAYRRTDAGRVAAGDNARVVQLVRRPSPGSTGVDLISQVMVHLNLRGGIRRPVPGR